MPCNEMPKPIRRTCIFINRYENESVETVEDFDGYPGSSKIRFRRFLLLKAKSLIHEFEIMCKSDLQYVHDIVKHTSHFKKIKCLIEKFETETEVEKLHDAVWTGDLVAVKALLDNGVSPNELAPSSLKNLQCGSMDPITSAIYKGFEEIVHLSEFLFY